MAFKNSYTKKDSYITPRENQVERKASVYSYSLTKAIREMMQAKNVKVSFNYRLDNGDWEEKSVELFSNEHSNLLHAGIAMQMKKAIVDGDTKSLDFLLTRGYGKPSDQREPAEEEVIEKPVIVSLNEEEKKDLIREINEHY